MGNGGSCRLFEKCVICKQEVAGDWARPNVDRCSRHFFHRPCLEAYARVNSHCPIDDTQFDLIVDENGTASDWTRSGSSDEDEEVVLQVAQLRSRALDLSFPFLCPKCEREDAHLERARAESCPSHLLHRQCLIQAIHRSEVCPAPFCNAPLDKICCELNDVLPAAPFRLTVTCALCARDTTELEPATPNTCDHRFHRECLVRFARDAIASHQCSCCPFEGCQLPFQFIRCAYGDRVWIDNCHRHFTCSLCKRQDREQEAAVPLGCDHVFHRACLMSFCRTEDNCPEEGCVGSLAHITCQSGDVLMKEPDPVISMLAEASGDSFLCQRCNKPEDGSGRAKLPCGCVFHRTCIVLHAQRDPNLRCPFCQRPFDVILCHIGPPLQPRPMSSSG